MEYWIWIQCALGAAVRMGEVIAYFSTPRELYEAGRREWILSGVMSSDMADKLEATKLSAAYGIIELCGKNGWTIVTPESNCYPLSLRRISNSPVVLYVWGDAEVLRAEVSLAFVGTRRASRYGLEVSYKLAHDVAAAGAVVVSGGALGVDSSSHRGAIDAGGRTIAFLGCGLGHNYLSENESLRREIAANGAVISEFQPFTGPTRQTFPIRNRLISGVSLGTVVIEAGEKSGSLITANYASQQGRDVFAVPGDIISSNYTGANKLIKDGAKAVFSAEDILEEYSYTRALKPIRQKAENAPKDLKSKAPAPKKQENNHKPAKKVNIYIEEPPTAVFEKTVSKPFVKKELNGVFSKTASEVYSCLSENPKQADAIAEETGIGITDVLTALTELEIFDYAAQTEGKQFTAASQC